MGAKAGIGTSAGIGGRARGGNGGGWKDIGGGLWVEDDGDMRLGGVVRISANKLLGEFGWVVGGCAVAGWIVGGCAVAFASELAVDLESIFWREVFSLSCTPVESFFF